MSRIMLHISIEGVN